MGKLNFVLTGIVFISSLAFADVKGVDQREILSCQQSIAGGFFEVDILETRNQLFARMYEVGGFGPPTQFGILSVQRQEPSPGDAAQLLFAGKDFRLELVPSNTGIAGHLQGSLTATVKTVSGIPQGQLRQITFSNLECQTLR